MDRFAELSTFVAVADTGDFTSAARKLDLTPSGVSKMTRLEERLGSTLLKRSSKGIRLTLEGESFLEAARRALAVLQDAESSSATPNPTGTLRVSCRPSFATYQLAPLMPLFQRAYPGIRVDFLFTTETRVLLDRQSDVAIASGALPDTALIARRFATSRWVTCASPSYLAKNGRPQTFGDLKQHVMINFNLKAGTVEEILSGQIKEADEVLYLVYEKQKHLNRRVAAFLDFVNEHFKIGAEPWR